MSGPASTWVEWRGIGICSTVLVLTLSLAGFAYCETPQGDERQEKTTDTDAGAAYEEALKVDPNNSKIYYNLGTAYLDYGDYPKALEALRKAVSLGENSTDAYFNLGLAHGNSTGSLEDAVKAFEHVVAIDPGYARAYVHLGNIYEMLGRHTEAHNNLKMAAGLPEIIDLSRK